jgi:hypothetical protein
MMLCYVCPTSGRKVAKAVDQRDAAEPSLQSLKNINKVRCPDCGRLHDIWDVGAWMTDAAPPSERSLASH